MDMSDKSSIELMNMYAEILAELNVIRNFDENQFEYLIAVIFDKYFSVKEAYRIPHETIRRYAHYSRHQNGYILVAMGPVLKDADVEDITQRFR